MTSQYLTRDDILNFKDIQTKEITVPDHIPAWGGKTLLIKQLSRGEQDTYLKRQFGSIKTSQDAKAKSQQFTDVSIYGHDAWLCQRGIVVDESGTRMFTDADIKTLNEHNGEAIGWVAAEIVKFSGMDADAKIAKGETTSEEVVQEDVKNS